VSDAVAAAELLPHGPLAGLPGTTHVAMTRSPERVLAMVVAFLDACRDDEDQRGGTPWVARVIEPSGTRPAGEIAS